MFGTTPEAEGEVQPVKPIIITDRSNVVVLLWFSVACFGVRVSVTFNITLVRFSLLSGRLLGLSCSLG